MSSEEAVGRLFKEHGFPLMAASLPLGFLSSSYMAHQFLQQQFGFPFLGAHAQMAGAAGAQVPPTLPGAPVVALPSAPAPPVALKEEAAAEKPCTSCPASSSTVPSWINGMLHAPFFSPCTVHTTAKKNECTFFCTTCASTASKARSLCQHCICDHQGHQVIQIRRYVYCDVVRVVDISPFVDPSGVQTYIINQAKVMFLNPRPQSKVGKACEPDTCRTCHRHLREGSAYCSLICKVDALRTGDAWAAPDSHTPTATPTPLASGASPAAAAAGYGSEGAAGVASGSGRGVGGAGSSASPSSPTTSSSDRSECCPQRPPVSAGGGANVMRLPKGMSPFSAARPAAATAATTTSAATVSKRGIKRASSEPLLEESSHATGATACGTAPATKRVSNSSAASSRGVLTAALTAAVCHADAEMRAGQQSDSASEDGVEGGREATPETTTTTATTSTRGYKAQRPSPLLAVADQALVALDVSHRRASATSGTSESDMEEACHVPSGPFVSPLASSAAASRRKQSAPRQSPF